MFNPIKNVIKGIGLVQGYLLGKDVPKPVLESIQFLIEAVEKPLAQWRQPITLDDDEVERIAHLVAQRIIDEGPHKLQDPTYDWEAERTELVNRLRHLEDLLNEKQEEPEQPEPEQEPIKNISEDDLIIEGIEKNISTERYPDHTGKKMCYRCWHLTATKPGEGYQKCAKYGIRLRATTAERVCKQFEEMPVEHLDAPVLKCVSCAQFEKASKYCRKFNMRIRVPSRNVWGICPHWSTRFSEPVVFAYAEKQIVKKVDAGLVDLKRNLESQNAEGGPL